MRMEEHWLLIDTSHRDVLWVAPTNPEHIIRPVGTVYAFVGIDEFLILVYGLYVIRKHKAPAGRRFGSIKRPVAK